MIIIKKLKKYMPDRVSNLYRNYRDLIRFYRQTKSLASRECPICAFIGNFKNAGTPPRIDAMCPSCGSLERHRLFWIWLNKNPEFIKGAILHFAPEPILERNLRKKYPDYSTADLFSVADLKLNIEQIELPSDSINTVICNHVLEHVNDIKALREINRILVNDGLLIVSVPIIEGWEHTYENAKVITPAMREVHFGQDDHVRFYGRDFRQRVTDSGFICVEEFTAQGEMVIEFGLLRGEKLFIFKKI